MTLALKRQDGWVVIENKFGMMLKCLVVKVKYRHVCDSWMEEMPTVRISNDEQPSYHLKRQWFDLVRKSLLVDSIVVVLDGVDGKTLVQAYQATQCVFQEML